MKSRFRKTISHLILGFMLIAGFVACKQKETVYNPTRGEGLYILTPKVADSPLINGPSVFGVHPGSPFFYAIPATGVRPLIFKAEGLPKGLTLDVNSGIITGTIIDKSEENHIVKLIATNAKGKASRELKIIVGDKICLTPPLGWNSWNSWKTTVTQDRVLASAKAMVTTGLQQYGWSYINIDDSWQGLRGGKYNAIQANTDIFPDIKAMCDSIHHLGLKAGIYSTPWVTSYAGFNGGSSDVKDGKWNKTMSGKDNKFWHIGKYKFDDADAKQWADWGVDYLKYDWNPNDYESVKRMSDALRNSGRDIVFSTSNSCPLNVAKKIGNIANCIRTAGDLKDRWDKKGSHLNIREQWVLHEAWLKNGFRGEAGHFPDPDMLVVGKVSTSGKDGELKPSQLTADEQYSHISLWTLWSAPMLIGAPIESMGDFTLNLLTNTEVLAIHQDELAIPAHSVLSTKEQEIFVKNLHDGSIAVGLFNLSSSDKVLTFNWDMGNIKGVKEVRDVWRYKNIGLFNSHFSANVPSHGVVLIKIKK